MDDQSVPGQNTSERFVSESDSSQKSSPSPHKLSAWLLILPSIVVLGIGVLVWVHIKQSSLPKQNSQNSATKTQLPVIPTGKPILTDIHVLDNPQQNLSRFFAIKGKLMHIGISTVTIATDSATATVPLTNHTQFKRSDLSASQSALPVNNLPVQINDIVSVAGFIDQKGQINTYYLVLWKNTSP